MTDFIDNPKYNLGDKVIIVRNNEIGVIDRMYYDTKVSYWRYDVITKNDVINGVGEMSLVKTIQNNIEDLEDTPFEYIGIAIIIIFIICYWLLFFY